MFQHNKPRYPINDLIFLLNKGRAGVYEAINNGELETYKVGKRRFSSPEALDAYIALKKAQAEEAEQT